MLHVRSTGRSSGGICQLTRTKIAALHGSISHYIRLFFQWRQRLTDDGWQGVWGKDTVNQYLNSLK